MITEDQLHEAFHAAGDDLQLPAEGPAAVLGAARDGATAAPASFDAVQLLRRRRHLIELAAAAAVVLIVGGVSAIVATSGGSPRTFGSAIGSNGGASLPLPGAPVAHVPVEGLQAAAGANDAAGPAAKVATGASASSGAASSSGVPVKIASSGHLTIGISRAALNRDVSALRSLATGAGGYVSATNVNEAAKTGQGSLTLSVPASAFPSTISSAEHLGTVRTLVTKANDVTGQYSDTTAQLQALGAVRAQLETLLGRATKVSDLLAVEAQIEQTQSQIDELQATERSLNQEITYATLTVNLQIKGAAHHVVRPPSALSRAWSDAISGFTGGLKWLLSISGALLFSLLLATGLGLLARLGWRRYGPRLRRHFL